MNKLVGEVVEVIKVKKVIKVVLFGHFKIFNLYNFYNPSNLVFQRHKLQRNRIHTMPGILRRHVFSFEDVAQVGAAVGTKYFNPATVGICLTANCSGDLIVKAWPAAEGFELVVRTI